MSLNATDTRQRATENDAHYALLLHGIDSLYVAYYLDTLSCQLDWDELTYLKEKISRDRSSQFEELALGTESFALQPRGHHPYTYVLRNKSFEVRLSERMQPTCYVQYFSEALWTKSAEGLAARFKTRCDSVGLVAVKPESVSRCDWAFDYHLPKIDFEPEHFISRAAKRATWHEHNAVQTVQLGQGAVVLRVYDKIAEIQQQSSKAWFFQLWGRDADVWRVECQVRRERLKQGGIYTLDDLFSLQTDLLRELTTAHSTLRIPGGDTNHSRWPIHLFWRQLQADVLLRGEQSGLIRSYDDKAALEWRLERCCKSIEGYMKNVAALTQAIRGTDATLSLDDTLERFAQITARHHSSELWVSDVETRKKAIELGQ